MNTTISPEDDDENTGGADRFGLSFPIKFCTFAQIGDGPPPINIEHLSECTLSRGDLTLLIGPTGGYKSTSMMYLGYCLATGTPWFGYEVCIQGRTLILQTENGKGRLYKDVWRMPIDKMGDRVAVSIPSNLGISFSNPDDRKSIQEYIQVFRPDVIVIDPWNSICDGDDFRSSRRTYNLVRETVGYGEDAPAIVVVHHMRKPRYSTRSSGRSKIYESAGSYGLVSAARTVFALEPLSDTEDDNRVLFSCVKNNNGPLRPATVWRYNNGSFEFVGRPDEILDLDVSSEDKAERLRELVEAGNVTRAELLEALKNEKGFGRTTIYKLVAELLASGVLVEQKGKLSVESDTDDTSEVSNDAITEELEGREPEDEDEQGELEF
ncbi:AAA family ATPase [Pelagicoccus enzymogenes]|uniref:AAA family ATPase n=1 Tax=Pelagicoccus enzymogenes TaxID=2773457 RepID=UPI00280CECB4|nr:AAA family ATPase [Pelagicoccus enzymogenes]MDQ8198180.1 AAA family ATPase [Pelagicoccus enzymogenes]